MRRPILPLALLLALATGIVLDETRLVALAPVGIAGPSWAGSPDGIVVRRFYDAANAVLSDADPTQLGHLVDPDFVDHVPRPGIAPDRAGLLAYLLLLRTASPTLRLTTDHLVAQGDRVFALVTLAGDIPPPPGIARGAERAWGSIDVFRVRDGRVAEHWGDAAGLSHAAPLLDFAVASDRPVAAFAEVDRRTLSPGAALAAHPIAIAEFAVVTAGTLNVAANGESAWAQDGPGGTIRGTAASDLVSGDGAQIEAGATASYRAVGTAPAEFLLVAIEPAAIKGMAGPSFGG
jgi:predicted SnoaL-like aldol condensation-catalyzing enzyme